MFLSGNDESAWWEGPIEQVLQTGADWVSGQVYERPTNGSAVPYPGYYYPGGYPEASPAETVVVQQAGPTTQDLTRWGLYAGAAFLGAKALGLF